MFKNKQKYFLISMLLLVLFSVCISDVYSTNVNETIEVQDVSINEDKLENSQDNIVQSNDDESKLEDAPDISLESLQNNNEKTLNGGKFKDIQNAINGINNGGTLYLKGVYEAEDNSSMIMLSRNLNIIGDSSTLLDGKNISGIFSIQESGSKSVLSNLKFINGKSNQGGAIIILGTDVKIQNSVFENNHANSGGAIYVRSYFDGTGKYPKEGENLLIENCNFTKNFAILTAGAIGAYGNNTNIKNCNFISNRVRSISDHEAYGGAIQIGRDKANVVSIIEYCKFIGNEAIPSLNSTSHGGAGCVRDGTIYRYCTFINNTADQGGALTYHASGKIEDCVFINNTAKLYGGALSTGYANIDMNLKVITCNFEGNKAPYGGAIQLKGSDIEIQNSKFNKNIAQINGGAVNIIAKTVDIDKSEFNGNIANVNGGAVYINGDKTTVKNSSFIHNEAIPSIDKLNDGLGGAIYINSSQATVNGNIFNFNVARNGSAVYYDKFGKNCIISDNIMAENQAWVYALPIYVKNIYYGENEEIRSTIYGGNNIAKYDNLNISNAIYNGASEDKIRINSQTPVLGATTEDKVYQDSREYNMDILLVVVHEDGTVAFNKTLKSSFEGEISINLENLKPGKYNVFATHFEDTYYKQITNTTYFIVYPKADLQVNKTSNLINVNYHDTVVWTLNVTNNGPNKATGVNLSDLIPEGLIVLNCDYENYDPKTGMLNISSLDINESKVITITTFVNKTGTFINNANVSGKEYDPNMDNNYDSAGIHVNSSADVAIMKFVNNTNPNYGDLVEWTLRVFNFGPDDASGVVVRDILPEGLVVVDSLFDGVWDVGSLAVGQVAEFSFVTLVNKTGNFVNVANVVAKEYDWNLTNNHVNCSITVNSSADVAIMKFVNNTNPNYGDLVEWTLRVFNFGPDDASGVVVRDILPEGLVVVDSLFDGVWDVGSLAVGQVAEFSFVTLVNKTGNFVNVANVVAKEYDWNLSNNHANMSIDVASSVDLCVKKYVNNTNPDFGEMIKWSIIVSNNGPDKATNIEVKDILDNGLIFDKSEATNGNYDVKTGIWSINSLNPKASETLEIYSKVNKIGNISNIVVVNSTEYDWNPSNNRNGSSTNVTKIVDLEIVKLVNNSNPNYKDLVKWTISVKNNGPNGATDVVVNELLPKELKYISSTTTKGYYDSRNGIWTIGNLNKDENLQLEIISQIIATGNITNFVKISGNEKDTNLTNNNYTQIIHVNPAADLVVKKTVSKQEFSVGELITYMIEVTNNGPDTAENVKVRDVLNSNLKLISAEASKGSFNMDTGVLSIKDLAKNENAVLILKASAKASGVIENIAVVSSDTFDWNNSNNEDNAVINVKDIPYEVVENHIEKFSNLLNNPLKISGNNIVSSLNMELKSDNSPVNAFKAVAMEKTGIPVVLLIVVVMILMGVLPIKISKR